MEFVTKELGMPKARLYVSIFEGEGKLPRDDEAAALWKKLGVAGDHIVALGRKDNFWGPAGGQGACGPCSEIYFDLGDQRPSYLAPGAFWGEKPGDDGDRYMEFWNLVFPQYDAQKDGSLELLPRPGIDTGMGLERLALIVQEKHSIFETDAFEPLVDRFLQRLPESARSDPRVLRDARIVADHIRAVTFALSEGVTPGNEGASYVLRRLARRAAIRAKRHLPGDGWAHAIDLVCGGVIADFGSAYPELKSDGPRILSSLARELGLFMQTLTKGLSTIEEAVRTGGRIVSGETAFLLHDTYGFPIELTKEIATEQGATVNEEEFDRLMNDQRERARAASKFSKTGGGEGDAPWNEWTPGSDSRFLGYDALAADGLHVRRWRERGDEIELILDRTPCYAESGGQVADRGRLSADGVAAELTHVYKQADSIVHRVRLTAGNRDALLIAGREGRLAAAVDPEYRTPITRHHTATHLLHAALRAELGEHARQAGSLVAPDRLRFDYTHFEGPSPAQLETIERRVNEWVLANRAVKWEVLPLAEARARGAMALFGEKYGNEVRMVTVEGVEGSGIAPSLELCGGTHVRATGEIGAFALVSDSAIASGVRRIEALCGMEALRHYRAEHELISRAAGVLQSAPAQLPEQVEKLKGEIEKLRKAAAALQKGGLEAEMNKLLENATAAPGGRWIVATIESEADANSVRDAADTLRARLKRGAALLALAGGGKLTFVAAVTDDLVAEKKLNASDLVKRVAQVAGGSGGGKSHLALAGGKDPAKLADALAAAREALQQALAS
jgi:alanyl-tRNA synthetase